MNEFVKVCSISELEENHGFKFQLDPDTEIAVFKSKNKIYAIDNFCPHNHAPKMADGFIKGTCAVCPVHFYEFSLETGDSKGFEGGTLRIFETKIEDGILYVKTKEPKKFNFDF